MIKICCERGRLEGWEKIRYARAIGIIVKQLKEFQEAIKKKKTAEVDYLIKMK